MEITSDDPLQLWPYSHRKSVKRNHLQWKPNNLEQPFERNDFGKTSDLLRLKSSLSLPAYYMPICKHKLIAMALLPRSYELINSKRSNIILKSIQMGSYILKATSN